MGIRSKGNWKLGFLTTPLLELALLDRQKSISKEWVTHMAEMEHHP